LKHHPTHSTRRNSQASPTTGSDLEGQCHAPERTPLTDDERAQGRRWLENWRVVGAILEEERAERLRTLTDEDAVRTTLDVWCFALPGSGDDGEGLVSMKHLLQKTTR
jgi:hypothetical protein